MNRFFLALVCAAITLFSVAVLAENDPVKTNLVWPIAVGQDPPWGTILGPAITVRGHVAERVEAWKRACAGFKDCDHEPLLIDPGPWGCVGGAVMLDITNTKTYTVVFKAAGTSYEKALVELDTGVRLHIAEEARYRSGGGYRPPHLPRRVIFFKWLKGAPGCARAAF